MGLFLFEYITKPLEDNVFTLHLCFGLNYDVQVDWTFERPAESLLCDHYDCVVEVSGVRVKISWKVVHFDIEYYISEL